MKKQGFLLLDALVAYGILTSTLILILSISFLHFKATQENNHLYSSMIVIENHLAEISGLPNWDVLNGTEKKLTDNINVRYMVTKTNYATKRLDVIFNVYGTNYSFMLERSDPNG